MAKATRLTQGMIDDYIAQGYWNEVGIPDILKRNGESYPDKEAAVDSEEKLTWAGLDQMTDKVAVALLESGIERDQAIVAQLPSSTSAVILLLACHKAGILSCFAPMTFRHKEMEHVLKTLRAVAIVMLWKYRNFDYFNMVREIAPRLSGLTSLFVIGDDVPQGAASFRRLMEPTRRREDFEKYLQGQAFKPFEVSIIVQSSGTTGMPKCIEHTSASCKVAGWGVVQRAKLTEGDVFGIIAPLSGGPGLQSWWAALQLGAKVCLLERFSPDGVLQLIQRERVTFLSAIPTQLIRILKECDLDKYDLTSLRVVRTGASALDASLAREAEERMDCKVVIAGGSQETYSFAQTGVDDPPEKRLATIGKPFPGNEIKIVDDKGLEVSVGEVGQLKVRGAATSSGYYENLDATLAVWGEVGREGWYQTGDLAKLDEQGYLTLVGRRKELIIRGGQNIYPREIENILLSHPGVKQAVVIGIPDPVMGEKACACLTLVQGHKMAFEEMIAFLKARGLAVHKLPERLEVMDEFPTLVDGQKVDKMSLIKRIMEELESKSKV